MQSRVRKNYKTSHMQISYTELLDIVLDLIRIIAGITFTHFNIQSRNVTFVNIFIGSTHLKYISEYTIKALNHCTVL